MDYQEKIKDLLGQMKACTNKRSRNSIVRKINLLHIKEAKKTPYISDIKICAKGCCPECDSLNGKIVTIEEALENNYLPAKNCSNSHNCNCRYLGVPRRDSADRLVMNS